MKDHTETHYSSTPKIQPPRKKRRLLTEFDDHDLPCDEPICSSSQPSEEEKPQTKFFPHTTLLRHRRYSLSSDSTSKTSTSSDSNDSSSISVDEDLENEIEEEDIWKENNSFSEEEDDGDIYTEDSVHYFENFRRIFFYHSRTHSKKTPQNSTPNNYSFLNYLKSFTSVELVVNGFLLSFNSAKIQSFRILMSPRVALKDDGKKFSAYSVISHQRSVLIQLRENRLPIRCGRMSKIRTTIMG